MAKYARTLDELKERAVLFWPKEVLEQEASISILPLLLKTQEKFISLLNLSDAGPEAWMRFVDQSEEMKGNLFLKHLMVLTDLGGEALNKLPPLQKYFKHGEMEYVWREKTYTYRFEAISDKVTLHNKALHADGKALLKGYPLDVKMRDVAMLLLHAASSVGDTLPDDVKEKCAVGGLVGEPEPLRKFVEQNYIRVSTQTRGATSNALGQIAQRYVSNLLREELPEW